MDVSIGFVFKDLRKDASPGVRAAEFVGIAQSAPSGLIYLSSEAFPARDLDVRNLAEAEVVRLDACQMTPLGFKPFPFCSEKSRPVGIGTNKIQFSDILKSGQAGTDVCGGLLPLGWFSPSADALVGVREDRRPSALSRRLLPFCRSPHISVIQPNKQATKAICPHSPRATLFFV
jgi:hypothetical protein